MSGKGKAQKWTDRLQPAEAAEVAAHPMTQGGMAEGLETAEPVVEDPWAATKAMRNVRGTSTCIAEECKGVSGVSGLLSCENVSPGRIFDMRVE